MVYVYSLKTWSFIAASRPSARNPLGASLTSVPLTARVTQLPSLWSSFLVNEK